MNYVQFRSENLPQDSKISGKDLNVKKKSGQSKDIGFLKDSWVLVGDNNLRLRRWVRRSSTRETSGAVYLWSDEQDQIIKEESSSVFTDIALSKEKRNLRFKLRDIHYVLTKCINNPSGKIAVGCKEHLATVAPTRRKYSPRSVVAIMQLLHRSVELKITGVFTDHGKWVSIRAFLMNIQKLTETNQDFQRMMDEERFLLLEKSIDRYIDRKIDTPRINLRELPLPDEARTLEKEEQRVVRLLQRLYPYGTSKGTVDPVKLLLVYPRYVSTERLFELIHLLLNASDTSVPPIQKQRLLCFCRAWISRGYHLNEIGDAELQPRLRQVVEAGRSLEDPVARDLADELSVSVMKLPLSVRRYSLKDGDRSSSELIDSLNGENVDNTAELFAEDCFRISEGLALNVPLYEMLVEQSETIHQKKIVEYFDQLSRFVEVSILSPIQIEGVEKGRGKLYQRIEFWIKVASNLADKGDFHSALAVVGGLNSLSISRLFFQKEGGEVKSRKLSKKGLKKWKKLDLLFSPLKGFSVMKYEISRRKEEKLPIIPYSGIFYNHYIYAGEGNPELVRGRINLEKLEVIAKLMQSFWGDLDRVRKNRKNTGFQIRLETDLKSQLERCARECDWDTWEISTKMKPSQLK